DTANHLPALIPLRPRRTSGHGQGLDIEVSIRFTFGKVQSPPAQTKPLVLRDGDTSRVLQVWLESRAHARHAIVDCGGIVALGGQEEFLHILKSPLHFHW